MHRIFAVFFCMFLFLTGCSSQNAKELESIKIYESYIDAVVNNKGIESKNIPFDYKMYVYKQKDNTYKYEIVISNPQVAMYNIQAIAVDQEVNSNNSVYPCLGLLGDDIDMQYNMIPYQAYGRKGFISGFVLDSISKNEQFSINVMVTWKDASLRNTSRVFFNCNYAKEKGDNAKGVKETSDSGQSKVQ